jgi:outer membrane receptor protein involved in Fe transport
MMRSIKSTLAPLHVVQNFSKFANGVAGSHLIACLALAGGALAIQAAYAADPEDEVKEIVVTGSRLSSANSTSPSPVVVVDNEELLHQGTPRTEEIMNSFPQVNSTLTLSANGAGVAPLTGAATVDLRGIGAFRTLVLIDGRRAAPGDPINPSADLNTIPSTLVKRVEILTGGASAIYGSDAIAGVVNFILDTNYTGFKVDVEGGIYQGNNNRRDLQAIERANGITPPTGTVFDGASGDLSVVYGKDLFGGSGHVTTYAGYRQTQPVSASNRDFAACTLGETGSSYQCLRDGTTGAGQFVPNGGAGTPLTLDTANGHAFRPLTAPGDYFNPAPYQDLQRPDKRYSAGIFGNYKFNEAANLYTEAQYTDDRTTVRFEPSGSNITQYPAAPPPLTSVPPLPPVFNIHCDNPLLSASQVNDLCTSAGLGPSDSAQVAIGRRNIEGGQRMDEFHHQSYRLVLGVKGEISEPWSYDVSFVHGRVNSRETLTNHVSIGGRRYRSGLHSLQYLFRGRRHAGPGAVHHGGRREFRFRAARHRERTGDRRFGKVRNQESVGERRCQCCGRRRVSPRAGALQPGHGVRHRRLVGHRFQSSYRRQIPCLGGVRGTQSAADRGPALDQVLGTQRERPLCRI